MIDGFAYCEVMHRSNCTLAKSFAPECKTLNFHSLDRIWAATQALRQQHARGELALRQFEDDSCFDFGPSPAKCCFGRCGGNGR